MELDRFAIKSASRQLSCLSATETDIIIADMADALEASIETVMSANKADLSCMDPTNPKYDRLQLTPDRIRAIATDCRNVSRLPSPLGRELQHCTMPNGLDITRISVPFGVIGVIYEARPNVTMDVTSLCLKAGSAVVLKGGKDADHTNRAIAQVIHSVLHNHGLSSDTVTLLPATRQATAQLLGARDLVDLLIPRGSAGLINYVRENASVPVIETGAGVVHCYVDQDADLQMAARIIQNAKCRRVSVCNALDCLLVHRTLESKLDQILSLVNDCVTIHYSDYGREWLSYDMSVKNRVQGKGCRYCSHNAVISGENDLAHIRKDLMQQWNFEKNTLVDPAQTALKSNKKVSWKCNHCGYIWDAYIYHRTEHPYAQCPKCKYIIYND